jgi:hypothetical protein
MNKDEKIKEYLSNIVIKRWNKVNISCPTKEYLLLQSIHDLMIILEDIDIITNNKRNLITIFKEGL